MSPRQGVLAAGNFIIDYVKMIDAYPDQDMLVNIVSESRSSGGGAYNVLKDLAKLGADYPLEAAGMIGDDDNGDWILDDCAAHGINSRMLHRTGDAATSYTDAMTVIESGRRTFFHQRGANAKLAPQHLDPSLSGARIFHLAYLMLLDTLDELDPDLGVTGASTALEAATAAGMLTSVDLVSIDRPGYRDSVLPSLPHIDYLFLNEIEAGLMLESRLDSPAACANALGDLMRLGVRRAVILHFEEGAVARDVSGDTSIQASLQIPRDQIAGATGAGDAFVAGCLHSIHDDNPLGDALKLGVCTAAASLSAPGPSDGVLPLADCLALADKFPFRPSPALS